MKVCPKCGKQYPDEANFCPVDAGRLEAAGAPAVAPPVEDGLVGGRFRLGERLGGRDTGEVYRAIDQESGNAVALKLVDPSVFPSPMLLQRSDRELKQLAGVAADGVTRVVAHGKQGDRLFIATELVEYAGTLAEAVATQGPLDPQRATELVLAVGKVLTEAAAAGVIHRDLSPKNILLTAEGVKIINFSVPVPGSEKVQGVPEFVAPEVIEGKPVDQRSNIYSLGAIYYLVLTGRPPFVGEAASVHQQHLSAPVTPPSQVAAIPADIDALVMRALEKNASKRFMTLPQMMTEVERVVAGPAGGTGSTAPFGRAGLPGGKGKGNEGLGKTMMGGYAVSDDAPKTRKIDVVVPPDAFGPNAAPGAGAAPAAGPGQPTLRDVPVAAPSPFAPPGNGSAPVMQPQVPVPAMQPQVPVPQMPVPPMQPVVQAPAPMGPGVGMGGPEGPQAPRVAAPSNTGAGGKGRKDAPSVAASKGKFRETMWFKKGDLDAAAAEAAEEERKRSGDDVQDKADNLPIEERYKDDGSLNRTDVERYSLKTGSTQMMQAVRDPGPAPQVSERELISDMKSGRKPLLIGIAVGVVLLLLLIILIAR
jgi:protein kinase-like protein/zinc ribbon protein